MMDDGAKVLLNLDVLILCCDSLFPDGRRRKNFVNGWSSPFIIFFASATVLDFAVSVHGLMLQPMMRRERRCTRSRFFMLCCVQPAAHTGLANRRMLSMVAR